MSWLRWLFAPRIVETPRGERVRRMEAVLRTVRG
jgi:hypothetical protein